MVRAGPANRAVKRAKIFAITKVCDLGGKQDALVCNLAVELCLLQTIVSQGFRGRAKNCYSIAVRAAHKALQYAYRGRRLKKREMRKVCVQLTKIPLSTLTFTFSLPRFVRFLAGSYGSSGSTLLLANMILAMAGLCTAL